MALEYALVHIQELVEHEPEMWTRTLNEGHWRTFNLESSLRQKTNPTLMTAGS